MLSARTGWRRPSAPLGRPNAASALRGRRELPMFAKGSATFNLPRAPAAKRHSENRIPGAADEPADPDGIMHLGWQGSGATEGRCREGRPGSLSAIFLEPTRSARTRRSCTTAPRARERVTARSARPLPQPSLSLKVPEALPPVLLPGPVSWSPPPSS